MIKSAILGVIIAISSFFGGLFGLSGQEVSGTIVEPASVHATTTFPQNTATSISRAIRKPMPKADTLTKVVPTETTRKLNPILPTPQKKISSATTTTITRVGALNEGDIIKLTNDERSKVGAAKLAWNATLSQIAYKKAKDMLDRQYFEHKSPDGKNIADLAKDAGYDYRLVGENLAEGGFVSSADVLQGWMNSPGHRANILKPEYTEMGAAAIQGMYEGELVWMAVQEFGKPMPVCEKPDTTLKDKIDAYTSQVDTLQGALTHSAEAIQNAPTDDERNQRINDYNSIVDLYNSAVKFLKEAVETYNEQVKAYNACIEG